jgi:hypothetical protein
MNKKVLIGSVILIALAGVASVAYATTVKVAAPLVRTPAQIQVLTTQAAARTASTQAKAASVQAAAKVISVTKAPVAVPAASVKVTTVKK